MRAIRRRMLRRCEVDSTRRSLPSCGGILSCPPLAEKCRDGHLGDNPRREQRRGGNHALEVRRLPDPPDARADRDRGLDRSQRLRPLLVQRLHRRRGVLLRHRRRAVPEPRHHGLRLQHRARRRAARVPRVAPRAARAEPRRSRPVPDRHHRAAPRVARGDRAERDGYLRRPALDPAQLELRGRPSAPAPPARHDGRHALQPVRPLAGRDPLRGPHARDRSRARVRNEGPHPGACAPSAIRTSGGAPPCRERDRRHLLPVGAAALAPPLHARRHLRDQRGRALALGRRGRARLRRSREDSARRRSRARAVARRRSPDRVREGHAPRAPRGHHQGRARRQAQRDRARRRSRASA